MDFIALTNEYLSTGKDFKIKYESEVDDSFEIICVYKLPDNQFYFFYHLLDGEMTQITKEKAISFFLVFSIIYNADIYKESKLSSTPIERVQPPFKGLYKKTIDNYLKDVNRFLPNVLNSEVANYLGNTYDIFKMVSYLEKKMSSSSDAKEKMDLQIFLKLVCQLKTNTLEDKKKNNVIMQLLEAVFNNKMLGIRIGFKNKKSHMIYLYCDKDGDLLFCDADGYIKFNNFSFTFLFFIAQYSFLDNGESINIEKLPIKEAVKEEKQVCLGNWIIEYLKENNTSFLSLEFEETIHNVSRYGLDQYSDLYEVITDLSQIVIPPQNNNTYKKKKEITKEVQLLSDAFISRNKEDSKKLNHTNLEEEMTDLCIPYCCLNDKEHVVNPAVGREKELEKIQRCLLREYKSPLLIGKPGVGKTAIVEGLAYLISSEKANPYFEDKKIIKINTSTLVSGCRYVGEVEERTEKIFNFFANRPEYILFLDEIHTLIGLGQGVNSNNGVNDILKPYLDRGDLKIIGATTRIEYEKIIMQDEAFRRRFKTIEVNVPDKDLLKNIFSTTLEKFLIKRGIPKDEEVDWDAVFAIIIHATREQNVKYNNPLVNPDLGIDILDEAVSYCVYCDRCVFSICDIIEGISSCEYLYDSIKSSTINQLNRLEKSPRVEQNSKLILFKRR